MFLCQFLLLTFLLLTLLLTLFAFLGICYHTLPECKVKQVLLNCNTLLQNFAQLFLFSCYDMPDLKGFRKANGLTQSDVASYLGGGVEKGFISQIEHGTRKLPDAQLAKLLGNDKGWDTALLLDGCIKTNITTHASGSSNASVNITSRESIAAEKDIEIVSLKKEIEYLKLQLAEEKERSAQYWEMIQKLMK